MAMQKPHRAQKPHTDHAEPSHSHSGHSQTSAQVSSLTTQRYLIVGVLIAASFLGAYKFAQAQTTAQLTRAGALGTATQAVATNGTGGYGAGGYGAGGPSAGGATGGGGGCCGGGGSQQPIAGSTTVSGDVQKVTIDLTTGSYAPNQITAKAGIPIELDFKGPASGCNGYVVSQQLGFQQDVSNGGTIQVPALQPGTYQWTCSMGMYLAQIIVK